MIKTGEWILKRDPAKNPAGVHPRLLPESCKGLPGWGLLAIRVLRGDDQPPQGQPHQGGPD